MRGSLGPLPTHERVLKKLLDFKLGVIGGFILLCFVLVAIFCPLIAPHDPFQQDMDKMLMPPVWMTGGSLEYPLGTDGVGRDTLSRIMYGTRVSLMVALGATLIQVAIGVSLGLLAGYYGGKTDSIISFLVNAKMGFPFILLAMSLVAVMGASLQNVIIALALGGWTYFIRIARAETKQYKEREFVLAATGLGFSDIRIMFHHILPNLVSSIVVIGTVRMARNIIRESALSFLGLGVQPPTPSWGIMLSEGRGYIMLEWWLATLPGLAIMLCALSANLLGDALRDWVDPHLRKN